MSVLPPLRADAETPSDDVAIMVGPVKLQFGWLSIMGAEVRMTPAFVAEVSRLLREQQTTQAA